MVAEKPMFRSAFEKRRRLIPQWVFEWAKDGAKKQPYFIHPSHGELFAFAGLWETWSKGEKLIESCTIIRTTAIEMMAKLHDWMPVIMPPTSFEELLDPATTAATLVELLRPSAANRLAVYPVDARVGNVRRNQGPELIVRVDDLIPA